MLSTTVLVDGHGQVLDINRNDVSVWPWSNAESFAKRLDELLPNCGPVLNSILASSPDSHGPFVLECPIDSNTSRATFHIERAGTLWRICITRACHGAAIGHDALPRHRELMERNTALIHALGDANYDYDAHDGRFYWFGSRSGRLPNFDANERADIDALYSRVHPDDRSRTLIHFAESVARGGAFEREYRLRFDGNDYRWVHERGVIMLGPAGDVARIAGIVADIDDHKRDELELVAAKERAESANRAKNTFLASMSHELRTPLSCVLGFTELLLSTGLTVDQREQLELIKQSGEKLHALISELLDLSRIDSGKIKLVSSSFDLYAVARGVTDLLTPRAHQQGLQLELLDRCDTPVVLNGDQHRIGQILTNLVVNALKFTAHGYIRVRVSAWQRGDGNAQAMFAVEDSGSGIPRDKQAAIFEKFTQVDNSAVSKHGGLGLGLAISKQLVNLMGGEIGVVSTEQRGSTFWFTVPLAAGPSTLMPRRAVLVDLHADLAAALQTSLRAVGIATESRAVRELTAASTRDRSNTTLFVAENVSIPDGLAGAHVAKVGIDKTQPGVCLIGATPLRLRTSLDPHDMAGAVAVALMMSTAVPSPPPSREHLAMRDGAARNLPPDASESDYGVHVLVVDDNDTNRRILEQMLSALGYRYTSAASGEQALSLLQSGRFEIILMDCQMPGIDGFETTRRIRTPGHTHRETPIVAVTARALETDRKRCLEAGMNDHLAKPITLATLRDSLERWKRAASR